MADVSLASFCDTLQRRYSPGEIEGAFRCILRGDDPRFAAALRQEAVHDEMIGHRLPMEEELDRFVSKRMYNLARRIRTWLQRKSRFYDHGFTADINAMEARDQARSARAIKASTTRWARQ